MKRRWRSGRGVPEEAERRRSQYGSTGSIQKNARCSECFVQAFPRASYIFADASLILLYFEMPLCVVGAYTEGVLSPSLVRDFHEVIIPITKRSDVPFQWGLRKTEKYLLGQATL